MHVVEFLQLILVFSGNSKKIIEKSTLVEDFHKSTKNAVEFAVKKFFKEL